MPFDAAPTPDAPAPAPGWSVDDVDLLGELAHLGMRMARALTTEAEAHANAVTEDGAEPRSRADLARASLDFTRVARGVRMTLALKARALGAEGPGSRPASTRSGGYDDGSDDDDDDAAEAAPALRTVSAAQKAGHFAEIRLAFEHLITDPVHEPAEVERLREALEDLMEREADEYEHFFRRPPAHLLERLCDGLGVRYNLAALLDETGMFQAWIANRPDDRSPVVWGRTGPFEAEFLEASNKASPDDTS